MSAKSEHPLNLDTKIKIETTDDAGTEIQDKTAEVITDIDTK